MLRLHRLPVLLLAAITLIVSGCETRDVLGDLTAALSPSNVEETFIVVQPNGAEIGDAAASPHLTSVLRAATARLRGRTAEDVAARYGVRGTGGKTVTGNILDGLTLDRVRLRENQPLANGPPGHRVAGVLFFGDDVGRSLAVGFAADYRTFIDAVEVERISVAPVFLPHPLVEMFVVPGDKLKRVSERTVKDYPAFYREVRRLAVDMRDPAAGGGGVQEYAFVVFVKDLAPPGSEIEFKFAAEPKSQNGETDNIFSKTYDGGWMLGAMSREIDLKAGSERWIKVVFRPAPDASGQAVPARMIGLFSTRPGVGTQQSARPVNTGSYN
ncbi:MAG: hypothetical protein ACTSW2_06980 [Alphaproteobacteria bacterium]